MTFRQIGARKGLSPIRLEIHNTKLEDPIKIRRYVRSASRGRFGPGIPYPIVGFRPVLAPAINIPVPKIPKDELVVTVE